MLFLTPIQANVNELELLGVSVPASGGGRY